MLRGFSYIIDTWSVRESLDAVGTAQEAMPRDAFRDMACCMYFRDDWDDENWDSNHIDKKVVASSGTAHHRRKFCFLEDACNACWKSCITPGI